MTRLQLIGKYIIEGTNQDAQASPYNGSLEIKLDHNNRIIANWVIGDNQIQSGTGFFKDNTVVINFNYFGDNGRFYEGVVVYTSVSGTILDGFWSEKQGDPLYLGSERCFKIGIEKERLD